MADYINPEEPGHAVTQGFGARPGGLNPAGGHTGRDKGMPTGRPLRAAASGVISYEGMPQTLNGSDNPWLLTKGGGICLVLDSDDGLMAFTYNHLSSTIVNKGQHVNKGDIICFSGNTGLWTTGPHVHFECMPDRWNVNNGTYGRINPDHVCKSFWDSTPVQPTQPNHRKNGEAVALQRSSAQIMGGPGEAGNNIVREIPAGNLEVFEGFVFGQEVTRNGFTSNVWYADKIGYVWCGAFEDTSTTGLTDLTPRPVLEANQRRAVASGAFSRTEPRSDDIAYGEAGSNINRVITGGTVEIFIGFVRGQDVSGNNVWFVDAKGFVWSGNFEDHGVVGLPDLTVVQPPPVEPPVIIPTFPHLNGPDVAVYQESAALQTIAADFYIIKASEGGADWEDKALASNVAEARLTGKPIIFYHFARPFVTPTNTAAEELRSFLKCIKPHLRLGDGVALDWEAENRHRTDWAYAWLRGAREATGAEPWFYGNMQDLNRTHKDWTEATKALYNWDAVEAEFPLWFASYGQNIPAGYKPAKPSFDVGWKAGFKMWQYTSKGQLPNYSGPLDLNVAYMTIDELRAMGATKLLQDPPINPPIDPPPPPDTDDLVKLTEFRDWMTEYIKRLGTKE